jgi:hypothetical protein
MDNCLSKMFERCLVCTPVSTAVIGELETPAALVPGQA